MNDRVNEVLLSCGWYEGRIIDISKYMIWYQSEGYKPPLIIQEFLKEFGGLKLLLPFKNPHNQKGETEILDMICIPQENGFEAEFTEDFNTFFKVDMYPVAASISLPLDFFMDSNGGFYTMYGSIGAKWGNSFEEFILNIMNGNISDLYEVC